MNGDKIIREQLGSVQVSFDKEAAWERLHGRLESKSTTTKYYRLGWAAAVLILVAMFWQLVPVNEQPAITKALPKPTTPVSNERITITSPAATDIKMETPTLPAPGEQKQYPTKKRISSHEDTLQEQPLVVEVIQEPVIEQKNELVAVAKPKMKVMHINDVLEEERVERKVLNSRYADNKGYDRYHYRSQEDNPGELRNPFKIYISTQN